MNMGFSLCLSIVLVSTTVSLSSQKLVNRSFPDNETSVADEKLCPPLDIDHGRVKCRSRGTKVSCASDMKPMTIATFSCNHNYKREHSDVSTLTCLINGTWDNTLPTCFPVCGFSQQDTRLEPRIIDGLVSHLGLFPWHAGVYHRKKGKETEVWEQKCGGSLITNQFVLTAAHCVDNMKEEDVAIAVGKHYRSWNCTENTEQKRNVSNIYRHEDFSIATFVFDIALLFLDEKIKFGDNILPVCHGFLGGYNNINGKPLFVVGWGKTKNGTSSEELLYKNVSIMDPNECKQNIPILNPNFEKVCLLNNNSDISVTQPGDSGGGLTVVQEGLHYILGIISTKTEDLSMLTDVSHQTNQRWIEDKIKMHDEQFKWGENQETKPLKCGESAGALEVHHVYDDGLDANIGYFPWHAALFHRSDWQNKTESWDYLCGGTLLTKRFVLTAAHCLFVWTVEDIRIAFGKYYRSWNRFELKEQRRNVTKIFYRDDYKRYSSEDTLGLLLLDKEIKIRKHIMPVCHGFVGGYSNIKDKPLFVGSWYKMKNGEENETLRYKSGSIIDKKECKDLFPPHVETADGFCIVNNTSDGPISQADYIGGAVTFVHNGLHFFLGVINEQHEAYTLAANISWDYNQMWIENQITKYDATFRWNLNNKK